MKQRDLWADLILQYCAHHRVFRLSLEETFTVESSRYETTTAGPAIVPGSTLFHNKALNRRLDPTVQREILDFMVLKKGQAQWRKEQGAASKTLPSVCYIYWKSLNEWADILYSWVPYGIFIFVSIKCVYLG